MATKNRLGRGLSALIPTAGRTEVEFRQINVSEIEPNPNQPRKDLDGGGFNELISTVKQVGVIQPVVVRQKEDGFEIVAGERRWKAAMKAGLRTIPCVVKQTSDVAALQLALIENIQRQDLNPIEEATAYKYLLDDGGMTQERLAKRLGLSRPYITNTVKLLRLSEEVKKELISGRLSAGHAKAIASLKEEKAQVKLARKVISDNLSVRKTEQAVELLWHPVRKKKRPIKPKFSREANQISELLGLKVSIKPKGIGGVVSIYYENYRQLSNLIRKVIKAARR